MHRKKLSGREILFEFHRVGNSVRVAAIDPVTRTEVAIVGDVRESQEMLERVAMRKLFYVIRKNQESGEGR